jgi:hypothetical protein
MVQATDFWKSNDPADGLYGAWFLRISLQREVKPRAVIERMAQGDVFSPQCTWPRRPERREPSVIKIRSSMPPAAYQRLAANPTIHIQMRF